MNGKNNLLEYLGIIWDEFDTLAGAYDELSCEADNGQAWTVEEAKVEALERLQSSMEHLNEVYNDIETLSLKKLQQKYPR